MADYNWKRNDTGPTITAQLSYSDGTNPNLTGAAVKFIMAVGTAGSTKVAATATIVNAAAGIVSYTPLAADTNTTGDYNVEWQVVFSGGMKVTFPDPGYQSLTVTADLDNA